MNSSKGFSLLEILVASGIAVIAATAFISIVVDSRKVSSDAGLKVTEEKQISEVIENLRSSIETYQATFDSTPAEKEAALKVDALPLAWSEQQVSSVVDCKDCPGRIGYSIQPFEDMRGLYLVTVRVTHKAWSEPYRDYEFVVGAR